MNRISRRTALSAASTKFFCDQSYLMACHVVDVDVLVIATIACSLTNIILQPVLLHVVLIIQAQFPV